MQARMNLMIDPYESEAQMFDKAKTNNEVIQR